MMVSAKKENSIALKPITTVIAFATFVDFMLFPLIIGKKSNATLELIAQSSESAVESIAINIAQAKMLVI